MIMSELNIELLARSMSARHMKSNHEEFTDWQND